MAGLVSQEISAFPSTSKSLASLMWVREGVRLFVSVYEAWRCVLLSENT